MRNAQTARLAEHYTSSGSQNGSGRQAPPVMIEYILVPGANHTDAIIEECLCAKASHLVEFLCYYSTNEGRRVQQSDTPTDSVNAETSLEDDDGQIVPSKHPDGTLWTPAPHNKRPLLIRLGSYVCPF
ncbi:ecotin [Trypanosoma grayi]|uniref:ecotin n=1 Tax=Trypanosoma grayi TaxID=71804 RepID=UPI0004F4421D|nr:ecotin [Trypanosoma grayi]KEG08807.1 ecotin [Trypanosoma grayi]